MVISEWTRFAITMSRPVLPLVTRVEVEHGDHEYGGVSEFLRGVVQQVELTFVATPHELFVVLEADKRGGMFSSGGDAFGHFRLSHQEAQGGRLGDVHQRVAGSGGRARRCGGLWL